MNLSEFEEKLRTLTQKYEEEVADLSRQYREANILMNVGDIITVDTEFMKNFIFKGGEIFKNNSSTTMLRCKEIIPARSYKTKNFTESVYVMEELTLKGTKKKHRSPLNFDSTDIEELIAKGLIS